LRHAEDLSVASAIEPDVAAIRDGRQLLDEPDPMTPLLQQLTSSLRTELKERAEQLTEAQQAAVDDLSAWSKWSGLDKSDRDTFVAEAKLVSEALPDISTDIKLLEVLDTKPLSAWQDRISLVPSRVDQLRQRVLEKLQPESVNVTTPKVTITGEEDLAAYLDDVRSRVQPHLDAGKTVIL
jgi:hypothetical protein